MKITCVGGGPTGLYFALLSKLRSPRAEVTVIERNAPGATHGWGVTWGDELLDDLYACDPVSARRLRGASLLWGKQEVRIDGRSPVHLGGKYGYSMSRSRMQQILTDRASELGVRLEYGQAVDDDAAIDADLVVAADGVGQQAARTRTSSASPRRSPPAATATSGSARPRCSGRSRSRSSARTRAGCGLTATRRRGARARSSSSARRRRGRASGSTGLTPDAGLRLLESVFAQVLSGHRLLEPPMTTGRSPWLHFREIRNATLAARSRRPRRGLGAHHALRHRLGHRARRAGRDRARRRRARARRPLPDALDAYDRRRRAVMGPIQDMAMRSMSWFEDVDARMDGDPVRVAYSLFDRRGDQAPWRYQLHLATQIEPLRQVRNGLTSARRSVRGLQRDRRARADAR